MDRRRPALLILAALIGAAAAGCEGLRGDPGTVVVEITGERFHLEVAADDTARVRGLMGRTEIPPDGGMIFIFPEPAIRSFWMGYCLTDIDLVFLDPKGRVTAVHEMTVEPPRRDGESEPAYRARLASYPSVYPAQFAIELQPGTIDRLGIGFDDKIELDLPRLKALAR